MNGRPSKAVLEIANHEQSPIQLNFLGGSLAKPDEAASSTPAGDAIVRNLTAMRYDLAVEPGEKKAVPYSFVLDMQPQDVRIQLVAVVSNAKGDIFQVNAHESVASIVEAPTSIFDPQM